MDKGILDDHMPNQVFCAIKACREQWDIYNTGAIMVAMQKYVYSVPTNVRYYHHIWL